MIIPVEAMNDRAMVGVTGVMGAGTMGACP
jgi:hypothetical protein